MSRRTHFATLASISLVFGACAHSAAATGWSLQSQARSVSAQTSETICVCLICCGGCTDGEMFAAPGYGPWSALAVSDDCAYSEAMTSQDSTINSFGIVGEAFLFAQAESLGGRLSGSTSSGMAKLDCNWTVTMSTSAIIQVSLETTCDACAVSLPSASAKLTGPTGDIFNMAVGVGTQSVSFIAQLSPGSYQLTSTGTTNANSVGFGGAKEPVQSVQIAVRIVQPCVAADINGDLTVNGADLGVLLAAWGTSSSEADFNLDGTVDGADIGLLLSSWGGCSLGS